ncbi:Protein of unknown function [Bacillus cereus]|uniref:Uncharacterized protein n=1 Tax=Bacillus mycoides TaxID=1405 RepID=A0A1G4ERW8_BACMY|nr:Protein of unknown function [Bacillus mycoides]SCC64793.1 Protein of unknown function [Bacillus cereus]SCN39749.1 Protein of unknown function [Bacillus wiedmannii]
MSYGIERSMFPVLEEEGNFY